RAPLATLGRADDVQHLGDRGDALTRLFEAVVVQAAHALVRGDLADLFGAAAFECDGLDLGRDLHDLVQADAAAVPAALAATAADGLIALQVDERLEAVDVEHVSGNDRAPLARRAEHAREPLRDDAVERRG